MQWVSGITVGKSSCKSVLVALCNFHHDKNNACDPSVATLSKFTELNRKTIISALQALEEEGLISSEKRYGTSSTYRLNFEATSTKNGTTSTPDTSTNFGTGKRSVENISELQTSTKNGTPPVPILGPVPKTVPVPKTEPDQYQKRTEPVPILGHKQENRVKQENQSPLVFPPEADRHGLNDDQPPKPSKRAARLPSDFAITPELRAWAIAKNFADIDLTAETEQFIDHHTARGTTMLDWPAAWRNWIRNAKKFGGAHAKRNPDHNPDRSAVGRARAAYDAWEREQRGH